MRFFCDIYCKRGRGVFALTQFGARLCLQLFQRSVAPGFAAAFSAQRGAEFCVQLFEDALDVAVGVFG